MATPALHYRWLWKLHATPEQLWPWLADTDRFDGAAGLPPVARVGPRDPHSGVLPAAQRLGPVTIRWDEQPFEWLEPQRFGVQRDYHNGPVRQLRMHLALTPTAAGGTEAVYQVWVQPRGWLGALLCRYQVGHVAARRFASVARQWDDLACQQASRLAAGGHTGRLSTGGARRLERGTDSLRQGGADPSLLERWSTHLSAADDAVLSRLRPYALADAWGRPRREVLELCLSAVRLGLLDLRWDVLCPLCRGAQASPAHLAEVPAEHHCEACHVDFSTNFEHGVELTFRPNPAVREVVDREYCVGGPQHTPHIVAQQTLGPGETRSLDLTLAPGRYRLRAAGRSGSQPLLVAPTGDSSLTQHVDAWHADEPQLAPEVRLNLTNPGAEATLVMLERTAWGDQAATAADVTTLQRFRDLFSSEALRPGLPLAVGSLTVLFTDLRGSTALYRRLGDAPAFGRVLDHFEVLRTAVAAEGGAIVKTMGDAVMAVFRQPLPALRVVAAAQQRLAAESTPEPLVLKAGVSHGPCFAVTLNERLDYFGSTVNLAARLLHHSAGDDVVVTDELWCDAEIEAWLAAGHAAAEPFDVPLKGFEQASHRLWRITPQHGNGTA